MHALSQIGGKWKPVITHLFFDSSMRFGEITKQMPFKKLKEMDLEALVRRTLFEIVPHRSNTLSPLLEKLEWQLLNP